MMIRLNVQRLLALRGIKRGRAFLINHAYTPDEVRGMLNRTPKEMSFEMMMRLCETFNCLPNDLFTWNGESKHHLQVLKKPNVPEVATLLEGKTPEEIEAILKRIAKSEE